MNHTRRSCFVLFFSYSTRVRRRPSTVRFVPNKYHQTTGVGGMLDHLGWAIDKFGQDI